MLGQNWLASAGCGLARRLVPHDGTSSARAIERSMNPHQETLERASWLLNIFPGVIVHARWQEPGVACIELSVQLPESASALEHILMGANVPTRPPTRRALSAGRYTFAASTEPRDGFQSGN